MRGSRRFALLAGLLLLASPGAAPGRELERRSFGEKGWNQGEAAESLPAPASFAGVVRGGFTFDLRRTGDAPLSRPETVFELVDAAGGRVLRVKVSWTAGPDPARPALLFQGEDGGGEYRKHGLGLWGPVVPLDQQVAPGQRIHVVLTWDDEVRSCAVYVDGRLQGARYAGYDPVRKRWQPDPRPGIAAELAKRGGRPSFDAKPLGYFLARVSAVHLGNAGDGAHTAKRPRTLLRNAAIESFAVVVDQVPAPAPAPPPVIASVDHDAARASGFAGKLVAGDVLHVALKGTAGAAGVFDVARFPDITGRLDLDWRGWGVYLEEKAFFADNEVNLRDVSGYRVFVSTDPLPPVTGELVPAATLKVEQQRYALEHLQPDTPYYVAVYAEKRDGTLLPVIAPIQGVALAETAPGAYAGEYGVGYRDRLPRAAVVGRLSAPAGTASAVAADTLVLDPALSVAVSTSPGELPADERSTARVEVAVTDANGKPAARHKVRFLLATTSHYTGVVGGGAFREQVGGSLREESWGETDLFGRVTATYVAGFAAKTAIVVARDMTSDDTGTGWIRTFIEAGAGLELLQPGRGAVAAGGYQIAVTSSDAWLTADGRSQARITARVTLDGKPVAGHGVTFGTSSSNGSVRAVRDTTDSNGEARALYTAGRKIGTVLVTATDATAGVSGSVPIELRSDAPAKLAVTVTPPSLPADGHSTAGVVVRVTDVNDNPNDNTEVEFKLSGAGRLLEDRGVTGLSGEFRTEYVAGRAPGRVSFAITVRSAVPTEEELARAAELALAVTDYSFF
jgi:hypothetical protein